MATGFVWHELYGWHDTGTYAGLMVAGVAALDVKALLLDVLEMLFRVNAKDLLLGRRARLDAREVLGQARDLDEGGKAHLALR